MTELTSSPNSSFWWKISQYYIYLLCESLAAYVAYLISKALFDIFFASAEDNESSKTTKKKKYFKFAFMLVICWGILTINSFVESNYLPDITIADVKAASQTIFSMFISFFLFKLKKMERDNNNNDNNKELEIATVV